MEFFTVNLSARHNSFIYSRFIYIITTSWVFILYFGLISNTVLSLNLFRLWLLGALSAGSCVPLTYDGYYSPFTNGMEKLKLRDQQQPKGLCWQIGPLSNFWAASIITIFPCPHKRCIQTHIYTFICFQEFRSLDEFFLLTKLFLTHRLWLWFSPHDCVNIQLVPTDACCQISNFIPINDLLLDI